MALGRYVLRTAGPRFSPSRDFLSILDPWARPSLYLFLVTTALFAELEWEDGSRVNKVARNRPPYANFTSSLTSKPISLRRYKGCLKWIDFVHLSFLPCVYSILTPLHI